MVLTTNYNTDQYNYKNKNYTCYYNNCALSFTGHLFYSVKYALFIFNFLFIRVVTLAFIIDFCLYILQLFGNFCIRRLLVLIHIYTFFIIRLNYLILLLIIFINWIHFTILNCFSFRLVSFYWFFLVIWQIASWLFWVKIVGFVLRRVYVHVVSWLHAPKKTNVNLGLLGVDSLFFVYLFQCVANYLAQIVKFVSGLKLFLFHYSIEFRVERIEKVYFDSPVCSYIFTIELIIFIMVIYFEIRTLFSSSVHWTRFNFGIFIFFKILVSFEDINGSASFSEY